MLLTSPGSNVPLFMVVIAYGKGIIAAEQYHGRVNAKKVSSFVREHLASMFKNVLTQREIFFCSMVILHRTASKPDLLGMSLAQEHLVFFLHVNIFKCIELCF